MSVEKDVERSMNIADKLVDGKKKKKTNNGFKRARPGFAQEKKELLKELRDINFHIGHSVILWSNREDQMDQKDIDEHNKLKKREEEILERLEEITVD